MSHPLLLRLLTFNIRHGTDILGHPRVAAQAAVIRASGADVVFLQEVDQGTLRNGRTDLAAQLAARAGLPYVAFQSNCRFDGGEFGNAIISRWPLSDIASHPIPRAPHRRFLPGLEGRGVLEAVVQVGDVAVRLLCAHFGFLPGEPALGALAAHGIVGHGSGPLVFGGDLNSPSGRSTCHRLLGTRLVDCAQAAGSRPAATFPAPWPRLRLDYLYVRDLAVRRTEVLVSTASDHRPLLAELELRHS